MINNNPNDFMQTLVPQDEGNKRIIVKIRGRPGIYPMQDKP